MKQNRRKNTTSKKADPAKLNLDGTPKKKRKFGADRPRGTKLSVPVKFMRKYPGEDPHIDVKPGAKPDIEKELPTPDDKASKHKYPPPKKDPIFREKWMRFIDNVVKRENFNIAHLDSLEILCDLYVEYDQLQAFIRVHGRSYVSFGRQGEVWKFYPEVAQVAKAQSQIKEYTKMLGLLLKKDHGNSSGETDDEWD